MNQDIFSRSQERQIQTAFNSIELKLQLDSLDNKADLERLMHRVNQKHQKISADQKSHEEKLRFRAFGLTKILEVIANGLSGRNVPSLAMSFAAGTVTVILYNHFLNLPTLDNSSPQVFRGAEGVGNIRSPSEVVANKVRPVILIAGDSLRLPGSTPIWMQLVELATEAQGETRIERDRKELRIWITLNEVGGNELLALRVALGLKPDVQGTVLVTFRHN